MFRAGVRAIQSGSTFVIFRDGQIIKQTSEELKQEFIDGKWLVPDDVSSMSDLDFWRQFRNKKEKKS